ncbi:MAG: bifunctional phosphopantothenoylcysteine decarboxylase/phosphopantothenate--cysteine ligase CoaBC [Ignavibacteriaceae bacterium]|jgi:phosphopantothenoylcysteine decarboxylase/phosphopantothenate--cysteine ligase
MSIDIFAGKKIILGISGGIAAYKSPFLIRELKKRGAEIKVVMTPSAVEFVTPLTLSILSGNEVIVNIFPISQKDGVSLSTWHIDTALWADLMILAPATINTVAKIAGGFSDNALTTLITALRCPLLVIPSADVDMYQNKLTQRNFNTLKESGYYILEAEEGELASGLKGKGRFPEIEKILDQVELILLGYKRDFENKRILISAGPTYEDIDPVRFIGNRSSGKMGYELAKAAYLRGADVTLVSGFSHEQAFPEIKLLKVRSAEEMKKSIEKEFISNEILIMSAAVADYKPVSFKSKKIKKEDKLSSINVKETEDILKSLDKKGKITIGFALETEDELRNAANKLKTKNLDMIVLNSLKSPDSGFEVDTNQITIINRSGNQLKYPLLSKFQVANKILSEILILEK